MHPIEETMMGDERKGAQQDPKDDEPREDERLRESDVTSDDRLDDRVQPTQLPGDRS